MAVNWFKCLQLELGGWWLTVAEPVELVDTDESLGHLVQTADKGCTLTDG